VYPKSQALKIAARTNERVLSTEGELSADSKISPVGEGSSASNAAPAPREESQQVRAPEPAPAPAPRAEPFPQGGSGRSNPEPAPSAPRVTRTEPLPQTASPLALSALIGVLSLAGAAGVRFLR
jgi:hypothetical protein